MGWALPTCQGLRFTSFDPHAHATGIDTPPVRQRPVPFTVEPRYGELLCLVINLLLGQIITQENATIAS
jgi:hypothetical protein